MDPEARGMSCVFICIGRFLERQAAYCLWMKYSRPEQFPQGWISFLDLGGSEEPSWNVHWISCVKPGFPRLKPQASCRPFCSTTLPAVRRSTLNCFTYHWAVRKDKGTLGVR